MAKPKMYGMNSAYIPNAQADMRHHQKAYQRGREIAERDPHEGPMSNRRYRRMYEKAKAMKKE
jgi:hypothetical protein